jgi:hypothetical protein
MLKNVTISVFAFVCSLSGSSLFAETLTQPNVNIPIEERAFVDAIDGFTKEQIVAHFGEPSKADDVKIKGTNRVVASIWQYHNINKAEDGSFYPTTELDFIDDKVVQVVFLNHNGEEVEAPNGEADLYPLQTETPL